MATLRELKRRRRHLSSLRLGYTRGMVGVLSVRRCFERGDGQKSNEEKKGDTEGKDKVEIGETRDKVRAKIGEYDEWYEKGD